MSSVGFAPARPSASDPNDVRVAIQRLFTCAGGDVGVVIEVRAEAVFAGPTLASGLHLLRIEP